MDKRVRITKNPFNRMHYVVQGCSTLTKGTLEWCEKYVHDNRLEVVR